MFDICTPAAGAAGAQPGSPPSPPAAAAADDDDAPSDAGARAGSAAVAFKNRLLPALTVAPMQPSQRSISCEPSGAHGVCLPAPARPVPAQPARAGHAEPLPPADYGETQGAWLFGIDRQGAGETSGTAAQGARPPAPAAYSQFSAMAAPVAPAAPDVQENSVVSRPGSAQSQGRRGSPTLREVLLSMKDAAA
jgi:hypothetical protein